MRLALGNERNKAYSSLQVDTDLLIFNMVSIWKRGKVTEEVTSGSDKSWSAFRSWQWRIGFRFMDNQRRHETGCHRNYIQHFIIERFRFRSKHSVFQAELHGSCPTWAYVFLSFLLSLFTRLWHDGRSNRHSCKKGRNYGHYDYLSWWRWLEES